MTQLVLNIANPSDLEILLPLLRRLNIVFSETPPKSEIVPIELPLSKAAHLKGVAEAVRQVNADIRGETQLPNIYDFLDE